MKTEIRIIALLFAILLTLIYLQQLEIIDIRKKVRCLEKDELAIGNDICIKIYQDNERTNL